MITDIGPSHGANRPARAGAVRRAMPMTPPDAAKAFALTDENHRAEAAASIPNLFDGIVLTPIEHEGRKTLSIDLRPHRRHPRHGRRNAKAAPK